MGKSELYLQNLKQSKKIEKLWCNSKYKNIIAERILTNLRKKNGKPKRKITRLICKNEEKENKRVVECVGIKLKQEKSMINVRTKWNKKLRIFKAILDKIKRKKIQKKETNSIQ